MATIKKTTLADSPLELQEQKSLMTDARNYVIGFIISIVLTLIAYMVVVQHRMSRAAIIASISSLAVLQFGTQLVFFLHLGEETKPRNRLLILSFMITTVVIIVFGSVWIMNNLNYHMQLSPQEIRTYMHANEGL